MTPIPFFYVAVATLFRITGVFVVLRAMYTWLFSWVVSGGGFVLMGFYGVLIALVAAVILWFLAKPIAALTVRDLQP